MPAPSFSSPRPPFDAIVIGAGAAGLAAVSILLKAGQRVGLIEARDRIGGRIHTWRGLGTPPVDLGPEFVHGVHPAIWSLIHTARTRPKPISDQHWVARRGIVRCKDFWGALEKITGNIQANQPDRSFRSFLRQSSSNPSLNLARALAAAYVDGFHAAPLDRMSLHALHRSDQAAEKTKGERQFRFAAGYDTVLRPFDRWLRHPGLSVHLQTTVRRIEWNERGVSISADSAMGHYPLRLRAKGALITLPLGVLQLQPPHEGAVEFKPAIASKLRAARALGMGAVLKVNLCFGERFWKRVPPFRRLRPPGNFGFLHVPGPRPMTWWEGVGESGVLVGWMGAAIAKTLADHSCGAVHDFALQRLAALFSIPQSRLSDRLISAHFHDWNADPFCRGSYSYIPVGQIAAPRILAQPEGRTLVFAGEATVSDGHHGTVHGALASGYRAAQELLERFG
jgi:monoamine oxidase